MLDMKNLTTPTKTNELVELVVPADNDECYCKLFAVSKDWFDHYNMSWKVQTGITAIEDMTKLIFYAKSKLNGRIVYEKDIYSSRQHDNGSLIGEIITDDKDGCNLLKVIKAPSNQGMIFKDPVAFDRKKGVCYIPEIDDTFVTGYSYTDFLNIAEGNEEIAQFLFDMVDWQHPETALDEYFSEGEIAHCPCCGKLYFSYEKKVCDKCKDRPEK